jgi:hypothetical protein
MDPVIRGDRGQALVIAALLLGLAAFAVILVVASQERLVAGLRDQRTGEAAVAAAGAAIADLQLARSRELGRPFTVEEIARFAAEPSVLEAARSAAARMARAHGSAEPSELVVQSFGVEIEVHLTLRGWRHVALLAPPA